MPEMLDTVFDIAGALLFAAGPCAFLAYNLVRRSRMKNGWRLHVLGLVPGIAISILLMLFLRDKGVFYAAAALVAWYYGAWFGGQQNEARERKRRARRF